jgi:sirohydrochlorin cobaltochelatase
MPSIQDAIEACARRGGGPVYAVPVLLFDAGHGKYDMPAQVARGRARFPELDLRAATPFGIHPSLLEIVEERLRHLEARLRDFDPAETAVLLVGRGASDAEANADLFKIGRLLWERNRYAFVECCFISIAEPGVPAGVERCVRLGARRVLVMPYFINTGILVKRIAEQAMATGARYSHVEVVVGSHLGVHPKLVDLILAKARALAGVPPEPFDLSRCWRYPHRGEHHHHHHEHDHHHHDGHDHHHEHGHHQAAPHAAATVAEEP